MSLPKRRLGITGVDVTIIGLGGEGVLRTYGYEKEAYNLINRAVDLGITYCESARAYSGSESYYGNALRERRKDVFLASKSHARNKEGARLHLQETLNNMRTDYLDLWQIHDVRTEEEMHELFGPEGALEAFVEAKNKGTIRFIGITGHQDPWIIKLCLEQYDFDTVLIPVNPGELQYKSFIDEIIPIAEKRGKGIIGMKVYFRGLAGRLPDFTTMEAYYRYALSHPISTAVIGCETIEQLEDNVRFAESFVPMTEQELHGLSHAVSPYARHLMYYKS